MNIIKKIGVYYYRPISIIIKKKRREAMKRLFTLILVLIMVFSLCACGGGGSKYTIYANDGTTASLSAKQLIEVHDTDGRQWENYMGARIKGSGKVTEISAGDDPFYATLSTVITNADGTRTEKKFKYVTVEIDDKTILLTRQETFDNVYVGDTVSFEGVIESGKTDMYLLVNCCGNTDYDNPEMHIFVK
ncbi:MAG: hypothetical protein J6J01_05260 [Oscillospiraceae bacterium]|nr:hypothetical protein [Oscillospiraceae bacterium]